MCVYLEFFNAQESKSKRFWHKIELVPVPSFHKFKIKHKIMQRWWSSEGSGAVLPSMDPVNLILHFLPLCTCCDGLLLILQWKLCFQRDPVGPRRVFWNNTKKTIHIYELNLHVISLFLNLRIQCLLNLALIYTSDAFIYTSEMFIQVSVLSDRIFWDCTKSKLQTSNPQDRNWLTGASGNKHKPSSSQIGLNLIFTLKITE